MTGRRDRWKRRVALAWLARAIAVAVPFTASFAATIAAGRLFSRPGGLAQVAWWVVVVAIATAAFLVGFNQLSRRLLPLAALLELDVAFPHQAPSRLRVALAATRQPRLPPGMRQAPTGNGSRRRITTDRLTRAVALGVQPRGTRWRSERVVAAGAALLTAAAFVTSLFLGQANAPAPSTQPGTSERATPALTTAPAPPVASSLRTGVEAPTTTAAPVGRGPRPPMEPTPAAPPVVSTPSPGDESAPAAVAAPVAVGPASRAGSAPAAAAAPGVSGSAPGVESASAPGDESAAVAASRPQTEVEPAPTTAAATTVSAPNPADESTPAAVTARIAKWLGKAATPTATPEPPPATPTIGQAPAAAPGEAASQAPGQPGAVAEVRAGQVDINAGAAAPAPGREELAAQPDTNAMPPG